jgi:hypothetical protein
LFDVTSVRGEKFSIDSIDTPRLGLRVTGPDEITGTAGFTASFDAKDILRRGTVQGEVVLQLSGGRVPDLRIPFKALVEPTFVIVPEIIVFAGGSPGAKASLRVESEYEFIISRMDPPEWVSVASSHSEYSRTHDLQLFLEHPDAAREGRLFLQTKSLSSGTREFTIDIAHAGHEQESTKCIS